MPQLTLESIAERVAALETFMQQLRQAQPQAQQPKDWRRVVGMFAGNETMKEIDELGRQIRDADRQETAE